MSDQLSPNNETPQDELTTPLKIVSFCFPIVGAIIYFTSKEQTPNKAKSACTMSLWGLGLSIILSILYVVLIGVAAVSGAGAGY